jgi:hypothetical protein
MADLEEITQLRKLLALSCRRLHDLLVQGTLIGWLDVPIQTIGDLAAARAQIEQTKTKLYQYGIIATDWNGELNSLTPFGLLISEPVLKEAEGLWTSNRYDEAVSLLRSAYATRSHDHTFTQRYLHYWYILAVRAAILGQLPVARHAIQEVVQIDPGYKNATELLGDLERQLRGEPPPATEDVPARRRWPVESLAHSFQAGSQRLLPALLPYGRVLIGGLAALIAVVLLLDLGRWTRAQFGTDRVPATPVTAVASVIAAAPTTSMSTPADPQSTNTPLPTPSPTAPPTATRPPIPTASPTAPPTALPSPTPTDCGTRRVAASALRVRDAPLGNVLHTVYQGNQLTLTCETKTVEKRQWVKIQVTDDPTISGWIRADYLK